MSSRSWLPKFRHLLGEIHDSEVARRAGTVQSVVTEVRQDLGIPAFRTRTLASYSPDQVLEMVRARSKRGESMRGAPSDDFRLLKLCRYHFGGWYQAVAAAGLKPEGKARRSSNPLPAPQRRALMPEMLRGSLSSAALERLTGIPRNTIAWRREKIGIRRDERMKKDRAWVKSARPMLGRVDDGEVARRVGVSRSLVMLARRELGIPGAPLKSMATSGEVRDRLRRMPKRKLRQFLAALNPIDAKIVEARYLRARPVTLALLGVSLGISRQAVAQRERRAVAALGRR